MMLERFRDAPEEALAALSRYHLSDEQMALVRGLARAQTETGDRVAPDTIRGICAEFQMEPNPILRALGWGPRDRDMLAGSVTMVLEDASVTAGTALCAIAKRHAAR
ncbi:MAG: hypothetical protein AAF720_02660 [Pseudomonadota bacterium]